MPRINQNRIAVINAMRINDLLDAMCIYNKTVIDGARSWLHINHKGKEFNINLLPDHVWADQQRPKSNNDVPHVGNINLIRHITGLDFFKTVRLIEGAINDLSRLNHG